MTRILPFALLAILILGGLWYFRFHAAQQSLTSSQTGSSQSVESSPIEVPKTLPGASLEDRVKTLEDSLAKIVSKVNSQPSETNSSLDSRLNNAEAAITELKARVTSLENSGTSQTTASSTSSKPTVYIPLGSSGQVSDQNWNNLSTFQINLDPSQYPGYKNMQLEVNMRLNQPGPTLYARLYNTNSGSATSSEITTTSTSSTVVSSSGFSLPAGSNTYILQAKTSDSSQGFLDYARIKVNF